MNLLLLILLTFTMTVAGENNSSGILQEAKEIFSSDLGTPKKCGERLTQCHTMAAVLGVLALGLFIINISTIAWFNRESISYGCSRLVNRFRRTEPEPQHEVLHNESDAYFH